MLMQLDLYYADLPFLSDLYLYRYNASQIAYFYILAVKITKMSKTASLPNGLIQSPTKTSDAP